MDNKLDLAVVTVDLDESGENFDPESLVLDTVIGHIEDDAVKMALIIQTYIMMIGTCIEKMEEERKNNFITSLKLFIENFLEDELGNVKVTQKEKETSDK